MNLTNPTKFGNIDSGEYPSGGGDNRQNIPSPQNYPWNVPTPVIIYGTPITPINIPVILPTNTTNTVTNNNPTSAQCSCLIGQAYIDNAGNCGCSPTPNTIPVKTVDIDTQTGAPIIYYTTPQNTNQVVTAVAGFDVGQFVSNNPLLVGGLVLGIIFIATRKK